MAESFLPALKKWGRKTARSLFHRGESTGELGELHLSVSVNQKASAGAAWVVHRVLGVLERLGLWFS